MIWYTSKWWRFAWAAGPGKSGCHVIDIDGLWVWVAGRLFWLRDRDRRWM